MAAQNAPLPQAPADVKAQAQATEWDAVFEATLAKIAKLPGPPENEERKKLREEREFNDANSAQSLCDWSLPGYRSAPFYSHAKAEAVMRIFYLKGYYVIYRLELDRTKKYQLVHCRIGADAQQVGCKKMKFPDGEKSVVPEGWTPFCPVRLIPEAMQQKK